jgi:rhamnulokinase
MKDAYIAVDFGGGSGRVMLGTIAGATVQLDEVHRFTNRQVTIGGHIYWDFLSLFQDMKDGLKKAAEKGYRIRSIGIDTWGVDFGLIDDNGNLLGNPVCYRDGAVNGLPEATFNDAELKAHYATAGIQVMAINTLYRLLAMKREGDPKLDVAAHLLFTPDLFSYFLTGVANNEYCIASTSELLDAKTRSWNYELIDRLGLPRRIFGDIVMPGTVRGNILPELADELGLPRDVKVIAVGSHDTASAVHAVPKDDGKRTRAYLSSGTWSLLGAEVDAPILTEQARVAGFTNEGGVGGKIRFLQNITGLWILQCLMAQWKAQGLTTDYDVLLADADASGYNHTIDVDNEAFAASGDMAKAIDTYCAARGVDAPATQGDYVRCVVRSLAQRYKRGIEQLNSLLPEPVECLHIIGGGCRNKLLNRMTEEAIGIPVIAGPVEATAIGNIMVQAAL